MNFKKHLETAWNLTLQHIAPLIIMTLVMLVVSALTLGILAPLVTAGYTHAIVMMMRQGREPRIQDLFSQTKLFLPLLGFSIVIFIALIIGFSLLILPGIAIILALAFGCFYMLPLMTDKQLGLIDAIKTSWQMALKDNMVDHIVAVILFIGLISIGGSVLIGSLFTQPFATVFLVSVYLERTNSEVTTTAE